MPISYIPEDIRLSLRRVFIYDYPDGLKRLAMRSGVNYYRLFNLCNYPHAEYREKYRKLGDRYYYANWRDIEKCLNHCGYELTYTISPIGEITP